MSKDSDAMSYHAESLRRVASTPKPVGQKFPVGSRVFITNDMPQNMSHFQSGKMATVLHTYAHAFGGDDVKSYSLDIDGYGHSAWYKECQLTLQPSLSASASADSL